MLVKKHFLFTFAFMLLFSIGFTQENSVKVDDLNIWVKRTKEISNNFHYNSASRVSGKDRKQLSKVKLKIKIENPTEKTVNLNAFSLVDKANKVRYRIIELFAWPPGLNLFNTGIRTLLKTPVYKKNGDPIPYPEYDPSVPDAFEDYTFEGYHSFEIPRGFRNDNKSVTYYEPVDYKKITCRMFYYFLKETSKTPSLFLYYGDTEIQEIILD